MQPKIRKKNPDFFFEMSYLFIFIYFIFFYCFVFVCKYFICVKSLSCKILQTNAILKYIHIYAFFFLNFRSIIFFFVVVVVVVVEHTRFRMRRMTKKATTLTTLNYI